MTEYHILNLGAGVQSTALYLMFLRGEIKPCIDYAIFADTQEEPEAVYKHLAWLQSLVQPTTVNGVEVLTGPPILVRTAGRIGDDLVSGRRAEGAGKARFATIPAFVKVDGQTSPSIQKRQCSREYKIEVIGRTIRKDVLGVGRGARVQKNIIVHQYIGISLDEAGRAARILRAKRPKYYRVHFPLIDRFMTRADCLTYSADKVPHETPRSACVFCPFHSDYEWNRIKTEDPKGWARAIEIDSAIRQDGAVSKRGLNGILYVHRQCVPLPLVQLDTRPDPRKAQLSINFAAECMGVCGV